MERTRRNLIHETLRRSICLAIGLVLVVVGVALVLSALYLLAPADFRHFGVSLQVDLPGRPLYERLSWIAAGAATSAIGALCVWLGAFARVSDEPMIRLKSADPELYGDATVNASTRGLRALVAKAARDTSGIRDADGSLSITKLGWHVRLKLSVWNHTVLPDAVREAESTVRAELEHHTGIPVAKVRVDTQLTPLRFEPRVA